MFDFGKKSPVQLLLSRDPPLDEVLGFESVAETVDTIQDDVEPEFKNDVEVFVRKHFAELIDVAATEVSEERAAAAPQLATTFPRNATALLARCFGEDKTLFKFVVERCLRALERRDLHPVAARNVARIVEGAFVEDPLQVTAIVDNEVQSAQLVHSLIRHCSRTPAVGSLVLAILGNAVGDPPEPTAEDPDAYAGPWQRVGFPMHLVAYIKVAMSDVAAEPYFAFMQSLLQNSLAPHFGVIVDDILALEEAQSLVVHVCDALDECTAAGSTATYPLLSEGLGLVAQVLGVLRAVFPAPACEEYDCDVPNRVLRDVRARLPGIVASLSIGSHCDAEGGGDGDGDGDGGTLLPPILGLVRLRVVDVCMAVFSFSRRSTDDALLAAGFFHSFLALAAQHPRNDILMFSVLDVCASAVDRTCDGGALLQSLVGRVGLLDLLVEWSTAPHLADSGLRAVALKVTYLLREEAARRAAEGGPPPSAGLVENKKWARFAADVVPELVEHWFAPITGDGFEDAGTGCSLPVVHRDVRFLVEARSLEAAASDDVDPIAGLDGVDGGDGDDAMSPDDVLAGVQPITPDDVDVAPVDQWEERDILDASDALAAVDVNGGCDGDDGEHVNLGGTVGKGARNTKGSSDSDEEW